ncbi:uncharacterized protein LOC117825226 isoform X2 [Xyrichtys novacula]|nr:uncharacterized protein LOC117825226 isoform X2 [Xyrichtys novacula]
MFKQWKEKYLVLTMEGSLLVCRDAESPPDQVIALHNNCETIAEGREILDLPKLPPGGRRDCCFALILQQNKFLLLLTDNPEDCNLWLNLIRKVREGVMSPLTLQRQHNITPCITDRDPLPDSSSDKEPGSPRVGEGTPPLSRVTERGGSLRERGPNQAGVTRRSLRGSVPPPHRVSDCLRHGNSSDARAVRAVCLLMGGAAASSALGYLNSCSPSSPLAAGRSAEMTNSAGGFSELSAGSSHHACSQDVDSPHFNSFDFEGDSDFDAFDCGGFAF